MTKETLFVVGFLRDKQEGNEKIVWNRPTDIGAAFGKDRKKAAKWATPKCVRLCQMGLVEHRVGKGYRLTKSGVSTINALWDSWNEEA